MDTLDRLVTIPLLQRCDGVEIERGIDGWGFSVHVKDRDTKQRYGMGGPFYLLNPHDLAERLDRIVSWNRRQKEHFATLRGVAD